AAGNREAVTLVLITMKMGMQNPVHLCGPDFAESIENAARSEIDQQRPAVLDQSVNVAGVFEAKESRGDLARLGRLSLCGESKNQEGGDEPHSFIRTEALDRTE